MSITSNIIVLINIKNKDIYCINYHILKNDNGIAYDTPWSIINSN